jgi:hypothetical protein
LAKVTKVPEAITYKPSLSVDSEHVKGMEYVNVNDKVTMAVEGTITGIRKKDQYEKGTGTIYTIEIDSMIKMGDKKNKPRVGIIK